MRSALPFQPRQMSCFAPTLFSLGFLSMFFDARFLPERKILRKCTFGQIRIERGGHCVYDANGHQDLYDVAFLVSMLQEKAISSALI